MFLEGESSYLSPEAIPRRGRKQSVMFSHASRLDAASGKEVAIKVIYLEDV